MRYNENGFKKTKRRLCLWVFLKRLRHCAGFGVQSPTDYAFVREVIYERWPYALYAELEANLLLHDLVSMTSEEQYRLASMRLQGYSIAETARSQGMSPKRVRKLLREMYQVYLKLYKD